MAKKNKSNNKPNKLAAAASRRLAAIGMPKMSTRDVAHALYHLIQDGRSERVQLDDGTFAWTVPSDKGQSGMLPETPDLAQWLERFGADPSLHQHG